jgi:DinB superfamily
MGVMKNDDRLREQLVNLLSGGSAHLGFEKATSNLPARLRGTRPPGLPHTPWRLVEHMRIAQWDILRFCIDPHHTSPEFPDGYWPAGDAPPNPQAWGRSITAFQTDLQAVKDLVADPNTDLFAPLAHDEGYTILREALLVADHNAYHLGQLVTVRRALGSWRDE